MFLNKFNRSHCPRRGRQCNRVIDMNAITTNDDEQCILSSYSPRPWPSLLCRCDHRSLSNLLTTAECEKGIKLSRALMTNGEHRSTTTERTTMEWNRIVWRRLCSEPKVRQKTSESYNTAPGLIPPNLSDT